MTLFKKRKIIDYHKKEIERLEKNLRKIANGNLNIDLNIPEVDKITINERSHFMALDGYLFKIINVFDTLIKDSDQLACSIKEGNINDRIDTTYYNGQFVKIGLNMNATIDTITDPLKQAINDLKE